jgi:ribosome-binding factor A
MASGHRRERVEELLKSFIASEFMMVDDAAIRLVTITAVNVSKDLRYATIYWCKASASPTEEADSQLEASIKGMAGGLRRRVAAELQLRYAPELDFRFDQTPFMTEKIDALLRKVD